MCTVAAVVRTKWKVLLRSKSSGGGGTMDGGGVGGFSSVLLSRERIAVFVVMLCKRP